MWIIFALISATFAALTSILVKSGIKETDSTIATAVRTIVVLIFAWAMAFIVGSAGSVRQIDTRSLIFLILSGLSTGASWLCYFKALKLGDINKVVPVDKSSTVLTIILAFIILGEDVTWYKAVAAALIAVGTLLMIQKKETESKKGGKSWLIYAVLSAVFASLTSILGKIGIESVESNLGTAVRTCVVLVMSWVMVFVTGNGKNVAKIPKRELVFILLSGVATGISWLCYYRALQDGPASVVVPIDKMSIVITVALSYFIYGEKLEKKALSGLVVMVIGTLIMTL